MVNETLAELAGNLDLVEVDGESIATLEPHYLTADKIANDARISSDSPRYSGMHHHCQYSRTG